jgi:hypothetical protein
MSRLRRTCGHCTSPPPAAPALPARSGRRAVLTPAPGPARGQLLPRARKTALLVTHDIDESIYLATRVIVFTARPGRIKADIPIVDMDRTGDFRKSPEYLALRVQLWDLLREEVLKAKALEEE